MRIVTERAPGRCKAGVAARSARGVPTVQHLWKHDHGAEAVEALALVAAILALLAVISVIFRDRASDVGSAATAILTRWMTEMPGLALVGGADAIMGPRITPLHHSVVSLPQLLMQASDAAPWLERAIGIAGSLLAAATVWRVAALPVLLPATGGWFRRAGAALLWTFEQVVGVFIGMFEGGRDMVVGLVTLAVDLIGLIVGDEATWRKYGALLEALVRDPLGTIASLLGAIVEPIVADWQAGRYGEAIGRAVFEVLPAILAFFTGGATVAGYAGKAGGIGRAADALGDAGRVISHIDDAGRIVDKIDDAGRIVGRIDDPARVANRVDDAAEIAGRIDDAGVSRAYRVQGGTPPRASHERIVVREDGGIRIVPEPGKTRQTKLYITFDDPDRARIYLRDNRPGGYIISFDVDPQFVRDVRSNAVRQAEIRAHRGTPEISDPTKTTPEARRRLGLRDDESTAYGLPEAWIERLEQAARPGTVRIERIDQ